MIKRKSASGDIHKRGDNAVKDGRDDKKKNDKKFRIV